MHAPKTCLPYGLILNYLSNSNEDHMPRDGITHSELAFPTFINNQDTPPHQYACMPI